MAAQTLEYVMPPNFRDLKISKEEVGYEILFGILMVSEEKYKKMQDECLEKWVKEIDPAIKVADVIGKAILDWNNF